MLMMIIIPTEKLLAPPPSMSGRGKAVWVVRLVLERLELRLRERVVVADARPTEATFDTQGTEQLGKPVRPHGRTAIRVHRKRSGIDAVSLHGLREKAFG